MTPLTVCAIDFVPLTEIVCPRSIVNVLSPAFCRSWTTNASPPPRPSSDRFSKPLAWRTVPFVVMFSCRLATLATSTVSFCDVMTTFSVSLPEPPSSTTGSAVSSTTVIVSSLLSPYIAAAGP